MPPAAGHHTPHFSRHRDDGTPNALQQQGHEDRCSTKQRARRLAGGVQESFYQRDFARNTQLDSVPEYICNIPCGNPIHHGLSHGAGHTHGGGP